MTVNHNEMLFALVDGQLSGKELEQAITLLTTDENARERFMRYQNASDLLHGYSRAGSIDVMSFNQRLTAAIAEEPQHSQPARNSIKAKLLRFPRLLNKQVAGLAMAASVGALAVVSVINIQADNPDMITIAEQTVPATSNRWTVTEQEVEERLNTYLIDHNEFAATSGVFSYGRVVSYGTD
ncbi:MAG: sigma-E factor negative regulatory protein [Methylophaga sp.]|nr:sigma-E factor negative regulatory protein [Methylophaga sp.]